MRGHWRQVLLLAPGAVPCVWLALLLAPCLGTGGDFLPALRDALAAPLTLVWCRASVPSAAGAAVLYGVFCRIALPAAGGGRSGSERGSARWGDPDRLRARYGPRSGEAPGRILTEHVVLSLETDRHRRNLNVLVIGGSGAGKTRSYALVNLLQANGSYVILDPKGEILRTTGNFLRARGYVLRVLDLQDMARSDGYNPFAYLRGDSDIQALVTDLLRATEPKSERSSDPFWDRSAAMLLMALVSYLWYEAPPEEQNFATVLALIRAGALRDENGLKPSDLDVLFDRLALRHPDHIAVRYYRSYRGAAGNTLRSVQITLAARLEKFNLGPLAALTGADSLELGRLGDRKTALFAVVPDSETSYGFLVNLLYLQLFQQLYETADRSPRGRLAVPVHLLMDEFANVPVPTDFTKYLATMRSRGISVSILIQNLAQLKAIFGREWESVTGNCDTLLYLGGNELTTQEYISKELGKETIRVAGGSRSQGRGSSSTASWQTAGRELLTPDEVRLLDDRDAIVLLRGERPVRDRKYPLESHPCWDEALQAGPFRRTDGTEPAVRLRVELRASERPAPRTPPARRPAPAEEPLRLHGGRKEEEDRK